MIKHGDLGEIRVVNMSFAFGGCNVKIEDTLPAAKWRFDPTKAGPSFALGDVGTYPLFILEAMIPDLKIDNLICTKRAFVEGRQLEDNALNVLPPQRHGHAPGPAPTPAQLTAGDGVDPDPRLLQ